ncbi:MAG TPA: 50S ribosomal protein L11 methyltransferase [Ignavibacteriales bacterium]|nr:50S ribosomal protein L11 methyltransferase [Ignavibacteriales bacterium]
MKTYFELSIKIYPYVDDEYITTKLWELEPEGVYENDIKQSFDLYFPDKPNLDKVIYLLNELKTQNFIAGFEYTLSELEEKNWNEEWEKNLRVIEISDKLVVKPSNKEYSPKDGQIVLIIDPKMSFGTGEHATTQMMLKLIEKYINPNDKVIDVGTGTGILAIAAIKLGANFAVAIDNDEWVYENILENLQNNSIENGKIQVLIGTSDIVKDTDFDMIIANIQKNVLLEIAEDFKNKVKDTKNTSKVLLSGILREDENDIINHYKTFGFNHIETIYQDEWCAIVLNK